MVFDPNKAKKKVVKPCCPSGDAPLVDGADESTPLNSKLDGLKIVDCALNSSSNILLLFRLEDFQRRSKLNFWLALVSLLCCGVNIGLVCLNYTMNNDPNPPLVSDRTFHLTEFWSTFLYSLVEAYALVTSPKTMVTICNNTVFLKVLFFFNVVAAMVPAFLMSMDSEYFETAAHEIEYINEFSLSLVSFILLGSLLGTKNGSSVGSLSVVSASVLVAALTFCVYNFGYEEYAHYLEFTFNIMNCLITFWFCMDNRFVAEMEIGQILFGMHSDCNLCRAGESEFRRSVITSVPWNRLYGSAMSGQAILLGSDFVAYDDQMIP